MRIFTGPNLQRPSTSTIQIANLKGTNIDIDLDQFRTAPGHHSLWESVESVSVGESIVLKPSESLRRLRIGQNSGKSEKVRASSLSRRCSNS